MADPYEVDGTCPVCATDMTVTRLHCPRCSTTLEGNFRLSHVPTPLAQHDEDLRFGRLARLDSEQLEFVESFLRCRGIIKNVEDMLGISYPTVRARLSNVLAALGFSADDEQNDPAHRRTRHEILADLAAGRITTEEAHLQLMRGDR
ncbi:MAG: DUF2089 domain-containing protein [Ktedonobacterales bacterium]